MAERFWEKVIPAPADQCWLWTGSLSNGYGQIYNPGGTRRAPRLAWLMLRGDIPDGLTVEHECRTTACVNPWHMDLWPNEKNAAGAINQYKGITHCKRNHEYTPGSYLVKPNGSRVCKRCNVQNVTEWRQSKRIQRGR